MQTAEHWITELKNARQAFLSLAVDTTNIAAFVLAQQQRLEALETELANARAQCETWRELAAERLQQLKGVKSGI